MIKDDAPGLERIEMRIGMDHDKLDENLSWLKAQMHRYFFRFSAEDADALTLLATHLHRMREFHRIDLVSREERSMIAQLGSPGSLYRALGELQGKSMSYLC